MRIPGLPRLPQQRGEKARRPLSLPGRAGPRDASIKPRPVLGLPNPADVIRRAFPLPPSTWVGTEAEWAIYWAHRQANPARGPEDGVWAYQGAPRPGAYPTDFVEYDLRITIDIDEEGISPASASALALALAGFQPPYTHIIIDKEDALLNPVFYLNEALVGRTHSRLGDLL